MSGPEGAPGSSPGRTTPGDGPTVLRRSIAWILRGGVVLSGLLLAAAVLLDAGRGPPDLLAGPAPSNGAQLAALLADGGAGALALLGVLVLLATPLVRVALSTGVFARDRDRPFTAITLFVLAVLGITVAVGVLR